MASNDPHDALSDSMAVFVRQAREAQDWAFAQAQRWGATLLGAYGEQAEDHNALLRSVTRSLEAMDELMESQVRLTKALGESIEATRALAETVTTSHQRGLDRLEGLMNRTMGQLGGQLSASESDASPSGSAQTPLSEQQAAYLEFTREWMEAFTNLMGRKSDPGR